MEILSGEQMRRVDRRAIDELGIPGLDLMENAGRGVADALVEEYPEVASVGVVVLCGKGNNGGDGFVAARHLHRRGVPVEVLLLAAEHALSPDATHNLGAAREAGVPIHSIPDGEAWLETKDARSRLDGPRIVLDAMLGTGVSGGARGLIAAVIDELDRRGARVVSVDLPSGIDADRPGVDGPAVRAERTFTLCRPKLALALEPASAYAGPFRVIPIGIPAEAVDAESSLVEWLDRETAAALLRSRAEDSHKGTYGHLLAVAGSRGKSGAAVLLARGALRSGVGLMTVATPTSAQERVAVQQAEVMTEPLPETAEGNLGAGAAQLALAWLEQRDALAVGPGVGTDPATCEELLALISGARRPMVIDADGLNALATVGLERALPRGSLTPRVLTPHPGEAARLLDGSTAEVQGDRIAAARRLARTGDAIVVLKGHRTLVADPDGRVAINASGNPGMATGGTGDVLTGCIGAFLARGMSGWDAARLAVFVHGHAGDLAARRVGRDGMIASDVVAELPAALVALGRTS